MGTSTVISSDAEIDARLAAPTDAELLSAYKIAVRSRSLEEQIVRLASRGEVKFSIWGTGEEVHGTATALALDRVINHDNFGLVPHYRSGALCGQLCENFGVEDYSLNILRQQFSRATDPISGGRQMVYHIYIPEAGILPVQSCVGMQLGKAAGYAHGFLKKGITDGLAVAIVGDGTTAEGDLHDAMNAASVWSLPVMYIVTDNGIAISTTPDEGRGIKDFKAYAESFGLEHFTCDGRDFWDVFHTTASAAKAAVDDQRPVFIHVTDLPRFNGHSSAADVSFDLTQDDPIIKFGAALVERGILQAHDVLKRVEATGRDFFAHHDLGAVMSTENEIMKGLIKHVLTEPEANTDTLFDHIRPPFPTVAETFGEGRTNISYAGAIRSALDKIIMNNGGVVVGQDVGKLGGVMQASAGLYAKHPGRVIDAPLNEPLIVGTSVGMSLHEGIKVLPEIQFGDYSLNAMHWFVYMGNLCWSTLGQANAPIILRTPTDPFGGGAMYHSMSLDGFYGSIPGLVIISPSTSYDVHGLLLTAAAYNGPVICLEPKWMYRQCLGPAFPGEPTDKREIAVLKKLIMRGEIPEVADVHIPLGKGIVRNAGEDVTLVAWGRAVWTGLDAAKRLQEEGIGLEVIDLRTIVPPDMEMVLESVKKTGRVLVASEDRTFGGFARQIQGDVVEQLPGTPSRSLGQKNIPGIGQSLILENATILTVDDIVKAAHDVIAEGENRKDSGGKAGWGWVPPRYFVS